MNFYPLFSSSTLFSLLFGRMVATASNPVAQNVLMAEIDRMSVQIYPAIDCRCNNSSKQVEVVELQLRHKFRIMRDVIAAHFIVVLHDRSLQF
jgi:hypothetical protein